MSPEQKVRRKLRAILSADVKGYSILMADDEAFTIKILKEYREIMFGCIEQFSGRVVDSPGDNVLAEFSSAVEAVQCAVEIQNKLNRENERLVEGKRLEFRIGVNIGDVVQDEGRIYGDGVNVASRIEGLADPGGVCLSRSAYDQIKKKLGFGFEYLGEHPVKNISEPVRVYKVLMDTEDEGKLIGEGPKRAKKKLILPVIILAAIVITSLVWYFIQGIIKPDIEPASVANMALPLPDKPSIAVLPFTNMSGDAEQEYFSDGMTEDLITDLSKISGLFVIARNSVFTYKGKPVTIGQVAEELGVRYVLEGSVRRSGNQIRINAQLIDATTGGHLWAERYDSQMDNIFTLQDGITQKIVSALELKLTDKEEAQTVSHETDNPEAYDAFLKGWAHYRKKTFKDAKPAISHFEKAIDIDSNYSQAYAALAGVYWDIVQNWWYDIIFFNPDECRTRAKDLLEKSMKNPTALSYQVSSSMYIYQRKHEMAITDAEQAIALDPNDPECHAAMAVALVYSGRADESLTYIKKAMRLDPHYPPYYLKILGLSYFGMDKYKESATSFERFLERSIEYSIAIEILVASYAYLGKTEKAKAMVEKWRKINHGREINVMIGRIYASYAYKNNEDFVRLEKGLKKAVTD
jgi:adenylate cyclase